MFCIMLTNTFSLQRQEVVLTSFNETCQWFIKTVLMIVIVLAVAGLVFAGMPPAFSQPDSDLFISEYIEGTGNNRAIELFNPTSQAIDLSNYQLVFYEDGAEEVGESYKTLLQGFIEPLSTFILVNGQTSGTESSPACDPELQALADQLDNPYPAPTFMDGNDAIALETRSGQLVDLIGKIGENPGLGWSDQEATDFKVNNDPTLAWTVDHTLIRKPTIHEGIKTNYGANAFVPRFFNPAEEWDTLSVDDWSNLGHHNMFSLGIIQAESPTALSIFPNPIYNNTLQITAEKPITKVELSTILGQTVFSKEKGYPARQIRISVDDNKKGLYLLRVHFSDQSHHVSKIIFAQRN